MPAPTILTSMPPFDMSSPPLRLELRVSNALRVALFVLALGAAWALWRSDLPCAGLLLIPVLLGAGWWQLQRMPWRELALRGDGSAVLVDAGGELHEASVSGLQDRGLLQVLRLIQAGRTVFLVFGFDTLDAVRRRELRLWTEQHLRREATPGVATHV